MFLDVQRRQGAKNQSILDKNPQELLNDIIEGVKYSFPNCSNGEHECFTKIEGQRFTAKGPNQQTARLNVVKIILKNIFNINFVNPQITDTSSPSIVPVESFEDKVER